MAEPADPARTALAPIVLGANQPPDRPYRGGEGIARLRGIPQPSPYTPEDFVASTTEVFGGGIGLTVLPDSVLLRDAIAADPEGFLGPEHVARFGTDTMLLTKLLSTAERLFVHYHPDDEFAASRLSRPRGKTEAWIVIDVADGAGGYAALGFSRPVSATEIAQWVAGQDSADMLGAMNRLPLALGDTLLVPAGLPHAIGPGVTLVELQQPVDLSILLEHRGYHGVDPASALLDLDVETAIAGLDRRVWSPDQLAVLASSGAPAPDGAQRLFPPQADDYFAAERLAVRGLRRLESAYSVLVVLFGHGDLVGENGTIALDRGTTVLVPHGAGPVEIRGDVDLIRALPPRSR